MTTSEKCDKPATAAIKIGNMADFAPACEGHIAYHRQRSTQAGKKSVPKGLNKAQAASFVGANLDDELPVIVRPLSGIEQRSNPICCNDLIPEGE